MLRPFIERGRAMAKKRPGTIGYLLVSREEQDLDKNRAGILALANRQDPVARAQDRGRSGRARRRRRPDRRRALPAGRSMLECMEILSSPRTPAFGSMRSRDPGGSTKPSRAGSSPWPSPRPPTSRTGSGSPTRKILWRNRYLCWVRADNRDHNSGQIA